MSKSSFKNTWLGTTTVKNDIGDLGDQITNNWNNTVRTSGNQSINGTKTFNYPLMINNAIAMRGTSNSITAVELTNQGEKNVNLDFIQPKPGFRNYVNLNFRVKNGSSTNFVEVLKFQTRDTGTGLYVAAEGNKVNFISPTTIGGIAQPTQSSEAANKAYVDSAIANIQPSTPQNVVLLTGNQTIAGDKTFTGTTKLDRVVSLGKSTDTGECFFLPNKDSGKSVMYIGNSAFNDNKRFDLDLQSRSKILNVPNPTVNGDAANKEYVDAIKRKIKEIAAASTDFNDFKRRIGSW